MDAAKLKQLLFANNTRLYGILDGVMVAGLPERLYRSGLTYECMVSGDLTPAMTHAAPYFVYLPQDSELADWIFTNGFGKNWGIFAHSRASVVDVRAHLRNLLTVYTEDGNPMMFRYYDPRILRKFLPTCNGGQLKALFGKIDAFFSEDESRENLVRFKIESDKLKQTELK